MKILLLLFLVLVLPVFGQIDILGLRTYANDDEYLPPIISVGDQVTIEFDVKTAHPPNLHILMTHASMEWVVDDDVFINDPPKTRAEILIYSTAPAGVNHYTFRYKNSFPNAKNFIEFVHSGNYVYTIVDHNANDEVLASGKFIVAESVVPVTMMIENNYHADFPPPMNQINTISVDVTLPSEYIAGDVKSIYHPDVTVVHIIKNWEIDRPLKIDAVDADPETFVENFTQPHKTFVKKNCLVGNEYRRLDISSSARYPNNNPVLLRDNPDVSRFQWQGGPDANGASKLKAFNGTNGDYLEVELQLRLAFIPRRKIFLVGGFSNWIASSKYEMTGDTSSGLFMHRSWFRRGVYDYQYVLGDLDENGNVIHQDWTTLEGNDWRTINRSTALVYYHDRRYGGVDRIVGFVRGRNPGTNESGKRVTITNPLQNPLRVKEKGIN